MDNKPTLMSVYEQLEINKEKIAKYKVKVKQDVVEKNIQDALNDQQILIDQLIKYNRERDLRLTRQEKYYERIRNSGRVECECGSSFYAYNKRLHVRSLKHKQYELKKSSDTSSVEEIRVF